MRLFMSDEDREIARLVKEHRKQFPTVGIPREGSIILSIEYIRGWIAGQEQSGIPAEEAMLNLHSILFDKRKN